MAKYTRKYIASSCTAINSLQEHAAPLCVRTIRYYYIAECAKGHARRCKTTASRQGFQAPPPPPQSSPRGTLDACKPKLAASILVHIYFADTHTFHLVERGENASLLRPSSGREAKKRARASISALSEAHKIVDPLERDRERATCSQ